VRSHRTELQRLATFRGIARVGSFRNAPNNDFPFLARASATRSPPPCVQERHLSAHAGAVAAPSTREGACRPLDVEPRAVAVAGTDKPVGDPDVSGSSRPPRDEHGVTRHGSSTEAREDRLVLVFGWSFERTPARRDSRIGAISIVGPNARWCAGSLAGLKSQGGWWALS